MRHVWPSQLPDDLISTYDLFWRLDGIAVELQTMVVEQLYEDHRQHLLEMKMGSRLWRELANPILHSSLHLPPEHRKIDDLASWDGLLVSLPAFAHHIRYLKVDTEALQSNTSQVQWQKLLCSILPLFPNLRTIHLELQNWCTAGINYALRPLNTKVSVSHDLILDFGAGSNPTAGSDKDWDAVELGALSDGSSVSVWWKGWRTPEVDVGWATMVYRASGLHLFRTPLAARIDFTALDRLVAPIDLDLPYLRHLSIVDCANCTFVKLIAMLSFCGDRLESLCYIGDDHREPSLGTLELPMLLPALTSLTLEMLCTADASESMMRRLVQAHLLLETPELQTLGVGSVMVAEEAAELVSALFRARFGEPNRIKSIYCNHYKPESGINGDDEEEDSEFACLARNQSLLQQILDENKVSVPLVFMMRCEYLDFFRGKEVGFYPEEYEFQYG